MANLVQAIRTTTHDVTSRQFTLPPPLLKGIDLFEKAHIAWWLTRYWALFKRSQKLEQDVQGNPVVYGGAIYFCSQEFPIVSYPLGLVLALKCIDELSRQYFKVYQAYQNLKDAVANKYPTYREYDWRKTHRNHWVPACVEFWYQIHVMSLVDRILKVMRCSLHLMTEMTKLAFYHRDVYLIAKNNPQARILTCSELFATLLEHQDALSRDSTLLVKELTRRQIVLDRFLINLGCKEKAAEKIAEWTFKLAKTGAEHVPIIVNETKDFLSPMIVPGKVTPMDYVNPGNQPAPEFTLSEHTGRYPPWTGQAVKINKEAKTTSMPVGPEIVQLVGKTASSVVNQSVKTLNRTFSWVLGGGKSNKSKVPAKDVS